MRIIDADELRVDVIERTRSYFEASIDAPFTTIYAVTTKQIENAPTIKTKEIKYFDEDEKIWKIGEVVVKEGE